MKPFRTAVLCAAVGFAPLSQADVVTDWNHTAIEVMKAAGVAGNPWTRNMAMMNVAMSDAVNTVQGRYTRFAYQGPSISNASAEAAAASAARDLLLRVVPAQKESIDKAYEASLKPIPAGNAKASGIAVGEQASAAVFADRANDQTNVPDAYRPVTTPGVWIPTVLPLFPQYAQAKPWGLERADVFRPGPPPTLSSALYARDFNETKEMGGVKSTKRTPEQTEAVKFWTQTNITPAWFFAAEQLGTARKLDLADNARVFALLSMAFGNAFITDWDAKFTYNFWRPMTAVRNADQDGNDATERDAGWTPLNATPMHPEYPSQAGINNGVATGVLQAIFGKGQATIVAHDLGDPKIKRTFTSLQQMSDEQKGVRIWGGIHFRNSVETGEAMGRKIADYLLANTIKPTQNMAEAR
jgi:hypothetical protein